MNKKFLFISLIAICCYLHFKEDKVVVEQKTKVRKDESKETNPKPQTKRVIAKELQPIASDWPLPFKHSQIVSSYENSQDFSDINISQTAENEFYISGRWKTSEKDLVEFKETITVFEGQPWTETIVKDQVLFPVYINLTKENGTPVIITSIYFELDQVRESITFTSSIKENITVALNSDDIHERNEEKALEDEEKKIREEQEKKYMNDIAEIQEEQIIDSE